MSPAPPLPAPHQRRPRARSTVLHLRRVRVCGRAASGAVHTLSATELSPPRRAGSRSPHASLPAALAITRHPRLCGLDSRWRNHSEGVLSRLADVTERNVPKVEPRRGMSQSSRPPSGRAVSRGADVARPAIWSFAPCGLLLPSAIVFA